MKLKFNLVILSLFFTVNTYTQTKEVIKEYKPYFDVGVDLTVTGHGSLKAVYGPILGLTLLNPSKHLYFTIRNDATFSLSNETSNNSLNKRDLLIGNFSNISYILVGYQFLKFSESKASIDIGGFSNYQGGNMDYYGYSIGLSLNYDWLKIELRNSLPFDLGGWGPEPFPISVGLIYRFLPRK